MKIENFGGSTVVGVDDEESKWKIQQQAQQKLL